jgi:phosphoribosylanthranilate isomerase
VNHLRIKICGITNEADGEQAAFLGADAIGLNFYAPSPRCIDPPTAARILRALPPFVDAVGLFVNQPLREIYPALQLLGRIRTIQWYGEDREVGDTHPYHLISSFSVRDPHQLVEIRHYLDLCQTLGKLPTAILVDAHVPGQYGGTGQKAPWHLLADFKPDVPLILAGGLTPENVAEAVRIVRPYAVDVASGVEQTPGRKDVEKMRRFIGNAQGAAAQYL